MDAAIIRGLKKLCSLFFIALVGFYTFTASIDFRSQWYLWGIDAANFSLYSFLLTLIPGIIKRLGLVTYIRFLFTPLSTFRRQIGIFTYLTAVGHFWYIFFLPNGGFMFPRILSDWMGSIALLIMTPIFITSNDFSVRRLDNMWKKIHLYVHVLMWFILLHVLIKERILQSFIAGLVVLIDVISWGRVYFLNLEKKTVAEI